MAYQATTGLGVAAQITVPGNQVPISSTQGYNNVTLSLTGANGWPTTFQLNPNLEDAAGGEVTPGTAYVLTSVATSTIPAFTLTAVAAASGGVAVYTGTITGGGSSAFEGIDFTITGFDDAVNNGVFSCTASTTTTLTLANPNAVADTHSGTAQPDQTTAVYTGTIGAASNTLKGLTFVVAGFATHTTNNGTFICTANNGSTTITLQNALAISETHAATATSQEVVGGNKLTFVAYGAKTLTGNTYTPSGTSTAVATVSASGLITAVAEGGVEIEVSYPTFNNSVGAVVSSGNIMNGLPINKIFTSVNVTVVA
jgi:hypothetical protein